MAEPTFAALVPAAGESSRMTEQKPLIQIGGQTLIERVVSLFQAAGVADVIVVVGHRGDEIIPVLEGTSCTTVTNPDYREGMFSSIRAGVRELRGRCDAFFVLPVDIPLVRPLTISHLMERFGDRSALITHPVGTSGRGHPPLIDSRLIEDLLAFTGTGGLRAFLDGHANRSVEVPVADAWVRRDLDTDGELEAIRRDFESYTIPTPEECGVILDQYLQRACSTTASRASRTTLDGGLHGSRNTGSPRSQQSSPSTLSPSTLTSSGRKGIRWMRGPWCIWQTGWLMG
jgi:CTP:molybdopterin cytidylyltransferase MocA